ncbi:21060_t:CDS:2, partial [Dentiscutata erythropus]
QIYRKVEETLNKVLPSRKGKKKEEEPPKNQPRKMDLNWRLEQINKTYSYTQGLTEEEIEEYLESIQKVTKIKDTDKPAKTRREYLYEVLSTLNETNDATIWKYRDDIKDLQEEYNRDIHGILGITAKEFNDMGLIEQQAAVTALITAQAHCKDEPTKQALFEKHKEFLEFQLEKVGDMHDDTEIQGRIYGDVINARKKKKPQILLPDPERRSTYKPYEQYDVPRDKQFIKENEQIGIRIPHSPTDDIFLDERLSQASRRNEDIPQGVLPKVTKFLGDVEQGIKNKFTSRPTTPSPLTPTPTIENSNNTIDRKRNKRGYTPSPDSYKRKQQRYKSPSLSSKHTDQISNEEIEEIEIPYYDNIHNEGQSSTYRPVHEAQLEADLEEHRIERFGQEVESQLKENKEGYGIKDDEEYNHILNNLTIRQKRKILPTIIKTKKEKIFKNGIVETPIQLAAKGLAIQQGRPNRDYILAMNISNKNIQIKQKYVDEFREKQEMRTSINNNVIPDIKFVLNKKEHEIPENDKNQGIRKYTVKEEKIIKELCDDLEKNDVIYPEYSKWASNVQIITKKDGRKAIVIDYRRLNKHLVKFKQPLPNTMQFLQDISRYKYYTTMDLKSAYWQLNVHPKSQKYTA